MLVFIPFENHVTCQTLHNVETWVTWIHYVTVITVMAIYNLVVNNLLRNTQDQGSNIMCY